MHPLAALKERLTAPNFQDWSRDCSAEVSRHLDKWASSFIKPTTAAISGGARAKADPSAQQGASTVSAQQRVNLQSLNPSLATVGTETISTLMPRYLPKAGLACERMQHMGMTIAMIRSMMRAVWSVPAGATEQSESALRDVFHLLDTTGDGSLDDSELLAVLPLLGETVPPEVLSRLFEQVDNDAGGTIDASEFVRFVRLANPHDEGEPDGWQAFLPAAAANTEEMVLLHVSDGPGRAEGRMRVGDDGRNWRIIPFDELDFVRRSASQPWSTSLVLPRSDLHNAEETIQGLRRLGFVASDILVVVRALFVTQTDADYARVFQVFDRDHTGGIDPFEFRAILALLGDHTTEAEVSDVADRSPRRPRISPEPLLGHP